MLQSPVRFEGTLTDIIQRRKAARQVWQAVNAAKAKAAMRPETVNFDTFRLLQVDQNRQVNEVIAEQQSLGSTPLEASEADNRLEEINRKAGLNDARKRALETPIRSLSALLPQMSLEVPVTLRKVQLADGTIDVALYANGHPWHYQPKPGVAMNMFLLAHDIERHMMLNRTRTSNLTNPSGEYNTGQVTSVMTAVPGDPFHYDGIMANVATKQMEQEVGTSSFEKLQYLIGVFHQGALPVGSELNLNFTVPPADIAFEVDRMNPPHRRVYTLNDDGRIQKSGVIPPSRLKTELTRLQADPDLCSMKKGWGLWHYWVTLTKPIKGERGFAEVTQFKIRRKTGEPVEGRKYCRVPNGKLVNWTEGKLIRQGHKPVHSTWLGWFRVYRINLPHRTMVYDFDSHRAALNIFDESATRYKTVYTGFPYQQVKLEQVSLTVPEGVAKDPAVQQTKAFVQDLGKQYQQAFGVYQNYLEKAWSAGTLPLNLPCFVIGQEYGSLLALFRSLKERGHIEADQPETLKTIQQGIMHWAKSYFPDHYAFTPDVFADFDSYVEPIPPPPFRLACSKTLPEIERHVAYFEGKL